MAEISHSEHLAVVLECIAQDVPVPLCPECRDIVATFTVAGPPIKMEELSDEPDDS